MLKKVLTYKNYNDEDVTEEFYFNLSRTELIEMEASVDGGLGERLKRIAGKGDVKNLFEEIKKIVLLSVGKRSDDGNRFFKSKEIADDFVACPAFDTLFFEIATEPTIAAAFVKGIIPASMVPDFEKAVKEAEAETEAAKSTPTPV